MYTWVHLGTDRTSQLYTISHTEGQTQIRVDHSMVGNGSVYLGTYHFDAGSSVSEGSVVISNQASATGKNVIADAIRFGNGMGDVPWGSSGIGTGSISGQPREDEAAILWEWRALGQGANPASVFDTTNVFHGPRDHGCSHERGYEPVRHEPAHWHPLERQHGEISDSHDRAARLGSIARPQWELDAEPVERSRPISERKSITSCKR